VRNEKAVLETSAKMLFGLKTHRTVEYNDLLDGQESTHEKAIMSFWMG
jgi:hypothetical protein